MNSATHHATYTNISDRRRKATDEFNTLDDERSSLRRRQRDLATDSEEYTEIDGQIQVIDDKLILLDIERNELKAEQSRLLLIKAEGFDYRRPARFINRYLPRIRKGTKEVDESIYTFSLPPAHWQPAYLRAITWLGLAIVLLAPVQFLCICLLLSLVGPTVPAALSAIVMTAGVRYAIGGFFILGAGTLFGVQGMRHAGLGRSVVGTVSHYVLGAEHWTKNQQRQSCIAYALYTPVNLLLPVVLIPLRFMLMRFVMRTYLDSVITQGQSPAIAAAATHMSKTTSTLLIVLGVLYVVSGALLIIS